MGVVNARVSVDAAGLALRRTEAAPSASPQLLIAWLQLAVPELVAQALERRAGHFVGYLGVDLHRDGDLGVPEDCHRYAWMHVEGGQQ